MFANDKNIDTLQELFLEMKKYVGLQTEYASLQLVEKLTVLLSTFILVFVMLVLGIMALFYLSFTLAYVMAPAVGGLTAAYGIITAFILVLLVVIAVCRERLIVRPMVRFLSNLFLNDASFKKEDIRAKQQEVDESAERMGDMMQGLFEREPVKPGLQGVMQHVETGIAIYDGVRTGLKVMRRVQSAFRKKRKR